jgi:hypothetical protein
MTDQVQQLVDEVNEAIAKSRELIERVSAERVQLDGHLRTKRDSLVENLEELHKVLR